MDTLVIVVEILVSKTNCFLGKPQIWCYTPMIYVKNFVYFIT